MSETHPAILLYSHDLMWISRCSATAQALGIRFHCVRNAELLLQLGNEMKPQVVLFDLDTADPGTLIPLYRSNQDTPTRFVAFGSHVASAVLESARQAGCDPVLPRSQMANMMAPLFQQWCVH